MQLCGVERKRTDKVGDLQRVLVRYLNQNYDERCGTEHNAHIENLAQLREEVRLAQDKNDATKDLYLKYASLVQHLDMRFPISENNVRLQFAWYDAYRTKKACVYSAKFEYACVLFNVAAVLSQLGTLQNRTTADGAKNACNYFKTSASVFQLLSEQMAMEPECQNSTIDLTVDALNLFKELMLGNAQFCVFDKAFKSNSSPSILAMLASQAATYYDNVLRFMALPSLAAYIPRNMILHTEIMSATLWAEANAASAPDLEERMKYGEAVSRLGVANTNIEESRKKLKQVPELRDYVESIAMRICPKYQGAVKDNNSIYHDPPPAPSSLSPIAGKSLVANIPPFELPKTEDPFIRIVPFSVRQHVVAYRDRKDQAVSTMVKEIDAKTEIVKNTLQALGQPGAIEALQSPTGMPQAVVDKRRIVVSENASTVIPQNIAVLQQMGHANGELLGAALHALDAEEEEDNTHRAQFGPRWIRTPSHTLTVRLRQDGMKYRGNWEHSAKSDQFIAKKWEAHKPIIDLLCGAESQLLSFIPPSTQSQLISSPIVGALVADLSAIDAMLTERTTLRKQLLETSLRDDITAILLANKSANPEEIFTQELKKYQTFVAALQKEYAAQDPLLKKLHDDNGKFSAAKQSSAQSSGKREEVLQQISASFQAYTELKANLKEGIQFHTTFQDLLRRFKTECDDFALARRTELNDVKMQIAASASSYSAQPQPMPQQQLYALPGPPSTVPNKPLPTPGAPQRVPPPPQTYTYQPPTGGFYQPQPTGMTPPPPMQPQQPGQIYTSYTPQPYGYYQQPGKH
ncbi:ALG-2 interacting protein X [Pelomyxa schiedti]|nr:ALG-2 interacting protein X [Pelomyxa schiedti]